MPQNLRGRRQRRFGHKLLIRGGLRAYALTLPLLGFECTWYEIKSRDMNEKGKEFIFYNKPYMPIAGLHGPLHMVCALSPVPCSYPSARSACTHTASEVLRHNLLILVGLPSHNLDHIWNPLGFL